MHKLIVREHESPKYPDRTRYNANSASVTLALATDLQTRGELLTKKLAGDKYLGFELVDEIHSLYIARQLFKKLKSVNGTTVNIAGNGIYTLIEDGCTQEFINQFVYEVISQTNYFYPIEKIYTGGQTGVDLAGAVAAFKLGIPVEVTLPHGFIQRHEDNIDRQHRQEDIIYQIESFSQLLHHYTPITKAQLQKHSNSNNMNNNVPASTNTSTTPQQKQRDLETQYQPLPVARKTFEPLDDILPSPSKASNNIKNEPELPVKNKVFGARK